jgi:hypothetical protein
MRIGRGKRKAYKPGMHASEKSDIGFSTKEGAEQCQEADCGGTGGKAGGQWENCSNCIRDTSKYQIKKSFDILRCVILYYIVRNIRT